LLVAVISLWPENPPRAAERQGSAQIDVRDLDCPRFASVAPRKALASFRLGRL
jgi:hypothetical protein